MYSYYAHVYVTIRKVTFQNLTPWLWWKGLSEYEQMNFYLSQEHYR